MEAYDRIIPESAALLRPGFWLVLELGYGQEEVVRSLIRESDDWGNPHVQADSQGIPRVLAVPRKCKP
jgi:methylase of polypeptide subunit release factors